MLFNSPVASLFFNRCFSKHNRFFSKLHRYFFKLHRFFSKLFFPKPHFISARSLLFIFSAGAFGFIAGCNDSSLLRRTFAPPSPHEQYAASLRAAKLGETALGEAWMTAGRKALETAVSITPPFFEIGYHAPNAAAATAYRVALRRGQYLKVSVRTQSQSGALFTDLFKVPTDSLQPAMRVDEASFTEQVLPIDSIGADPQNFRLRNLLRELRLEVKEDGFYLLRLQPELLRGGRYEISVQLSASLAFPVSGGTAKSVRSFFGDARDGGRRKHEGIDIFAARHTPILAATDGEVNFVGENTLGGKVVWQYDRRRQVGIYYAHLDTQFVVANTYAKMGDTLGLMGNTGNARTTPPHLHFGVYAKGGAVDPYPFVYESYPPPPVVTPDGERLAGRLGEWVHTVGTALLLVSTDKKSLAMSTLPKHLPLTIVGSHDKHYRALLPDGRTGYVAMKSLSDKPLRAQTLPRGERLYQTPEREAAVIDSLAGGTPVSVLGSFDAFLYIQTPKGQRGWLAPAN